MKTISLLRNQLQKPLIIFWIYFSVVAIATIIRILLDLNLPYPEGSFGFIVNSSFNNFTIYSNSFYHLIHHSNLYGFFNTEQFDEFLYSPAFTLLIMPFALLPKYIGILTWALFNGLSIYFAIRMLEIDEKKKVFILWFILLELITSIQNIQVNPLITALFIFTFIAFERKKIGLAALLIVLSMSIKVLGVIGASMFLLYPNKGKFIAHFVFWSIIIFLSPIVFVSFQELVQLYRNWFHTLLGDHKANTGDISVMRMLSRVSKIEFSEIFRFSLQLFAVLGFCIKYISYKSFNSLKFRYFFLASVMIWSTIFNHAVESCGYIIAMTGVAIWYAQDGKSKLNLSLLIFAFILCSLSPTDIFPKFLRDNYVVPMALKSLPCFLIWIKLEYDLISRKKFNLSMEN